VKSLKKHRPFSFCVSVGLVGLGSLFGLYWGIVGLGLVSLGSWVLVLGLDLPSVLVSSMVFGLWSLVCGLWFSVFSCFGFWFLVFGFWFLVFGFWFLVFGLVFSLGWICTNGNGGFLHSKMMFMIERFA
jgi:hypothetical protein